MWSQLKEVAEECRCTGFSLLFLLPGYPEMSSSSLLGHFCPVTILKAKEPGDHELKPWKL